MRAGPSDAGNLTGRLNSTAASAKTAAMSSWQPQTVRIAVDDDRAIVADIAGAAGAPTVVLGHGGGQTRHSWDKCELQLAEAQSAEAKDDHAKMNAEALIDVLKRLQSKAA